MNRLCCLAILFAALLLPACSQDTAPPEKPQVAETQKPPQPAAQQQATPATAATAVEEKVATGAAAVAEKTEGGGAAKPVAEQQASEAPKAAPQVATPAAPAPETKPATAAATASAPPAAKKPGLVTYKASMGPVTFDHAKHSGKFACSRCHTTDPPQAIAMSKALAHDQPCKACHKESGGDAPTTCNGCHKK